MAPTHERTLASTLSSAGLAKQQVQNGQHASVNFAGPVWQTLPSCLCSLLNRQCHASDHGVLTCPDSCCFGMPASCSYYVILILTQAQAASRLGNSKLCVNAYS